MNNLYNWPYYDNNVIEEANNVLKSGKINYWTGNEVKLFEKEFAEYVGTKYAVALCNGTVAIELALKIIGIKENDEVIVTSRTFVASATTIILAGGIPVFADVDLNTQNITLETIKNKITKKTKGIILVHLAGWPCDMDPIIEYSKKNNLFIIEDCAQAHGAKYKGRSVGSFGDINTWSFCQDKIMSTGGEGGMITLNNEELYKKIWSYKDHGKSYDLVFNSNNNDYNKKYKFKWLHENLGTNWRLTEFQAAIGRNLLKKLDDWVKIRRFNANKFNKTLKNINCVRLAIPNDNKYYHSYYKYYIFIIENQLKEGWNKMRIIEEINNYNVPCFYGSCSEIYLEKVFDNEKYNKITLPNAKILGETSLMFVVHPTISENEIIEYSNIVKKVLIDASL